MEVLYLYHMIGGIERLQDLLFQKDKGVEDFKLQIEFIIGNIIGKDNRNQIKKAYDDKFIELQQDKKSDEVSNTYNAAFYALGEIWDHLDNALHISQEDAWGVISGLDDQWLLNLQRLKKEYEGNAFQLGSVEKPR